MEAHFSEYKKHKIFYDGIFGQANLPFAALSSIICGRLLNFGRRPILMLTSVFSFLGMLIYLIDSIWAFIMGKAVMGIAFGMLQLIGGRVIEEYVPPQLYGTVMLIYMFTQTLSLMITVIIASNFIPTDPVKLATSNFWRGFLVWPLPLTVIALAIIFFLLKHEPPKFLITQGRQGDAVESIKASYHPDEDPEEIL
jgi:hypothetical protein